MARSDQTEYVFEVLEGTAAGRTIPLVGRSAPYRAGAGGSISYGRTMRSKLTWFPGNPVASQQIIGPILKPTPINGVWKERYLGTDAAIDLVELFEELLDTGVQVRVSWQTIERQGIVKDFTWHPGDPTGGLSDIRWEMILEWNSAGIPPPRTVGESDATLRDGLVRAAGAVASLGQSIERFAEGIGTFVGVAKTSFQKVKAELEDLVETLTQPLETLAFTAASLGDEFVIPARLVEDASAAVGIAQETSALTAEVVADIFPGSVMDDDGLESVLGDALARATLVDAAFDAVEELHEQRLRLEGLARPEASTTITPVAGSDLRAVALKFYGDADLWRRVATANGLEGSLIPDDLDVLVIPLAATDALDPGVGC